MEPNPEPRPSKLLLANSVVVIAACMFLVALGIAGLTTSWDPCAMFGGLIIIPLPALLGFLQYAATFKRRAKSAADATVLAFLFSSFPLLISVVSTSQFLLEGETPPLELSLMPLVFAAPFVSAGFLNLQWSRQLKASGFQPADKRFRISVRELLAMTAFIGAMLAMTITFVRGAPKQFGVDVTAEEAGVHVPENASRVSYAHGFRGNIAYEFDTDEASFRQWVEGGIGSLEAERANVPLEEIRGGATISRFYSMTDGVTGPDTITVEHGLCYDWSFEDRAVYAIFDRTTGRAYFYHQTY